MADNRQRTRQQLCQSRAKFDRGDDFPQVAWPAQSGRGQTPRRSPACHPLADGAGSDPIIPLPTYDAYRLTGLARPRLSRSVVFSTTDTSFHGHPHPLSSPPGITRKSVSLYYYTAGRPAEERSAPHDTLFIAG